MADIAAADVAYTLQGGTASANPADPRFRGVFKVVFGNGSLTYPSGGVPLTKAKLGCPTNLQQLTLLDNMSSDGLIYKYDRTNAKIRIYKPRAAHAHDVLIIGGQAAASTAAVAYYATDILGKEAATNKTILGADSATKGGVTSTAAAAADELTGGSTAVTSATTLYVDVVGY